MMSKSLAISFRAVEHEAGNEERVKEAAEGKKIQRKNQTSQLVTKLPSEIHCEIFNYLGPTGRRLFGATCSSLYSTYRGCKDYHQKDFVVGISELHGTQGYEDILAEWFYDAKRDKQWSAERSEKQRRIWRKATVNFLEAVVEGRSWDSISQVFPYQAGKAVIELDVRKQQRV